METSNPNNIKLLYSNVLASAIRKELFGIDPLDNGEIEAENSENRCTSSSPKHLYEDRFQVDRTKLRRMIHTSNSIQKKSEADIYFENIMKSTDTHIEWPRSYKNDTKCKQHPHVRVCGSRLEDVTWAKNLVLSSLEVNNSFLRLKMAISNADHLFILGRNNNNVNRIMDVTETHVQFPDSNQMKKENQIIVYGTLDGLENARALLRSSSPLLMSFEFPMNQTIPFVDKIGIYFKVQVIFSASSKPNTSIVLVRGSVRRVDKIKEATRSLLNSAFGKLANSTIVSVQLAIPPHHQESVKGEDSANIMAIMERTNTKIFFPEIPTRGYRKSQVTITGTIDEVCMAREELVASFPTELTFDIPDGSASEIMDMGKRAGLCITISQKEREYGMSVTIKGAERLMDTIYEVHCNILKLKPIFPSKDKFMPKSLYLPMDNKTEKILERSDFVTSSMECSSNERSIYNEELPPMISPDSGHGSQASFRGGLQQNQWTIFDNQGSHPSDSTELPAIYSPTVTSYHHSNTFIQPHDQSTFLSQSIQSYTDFLPNSYKEYNLDFVSDCSQEQPQLKCPSDSNHKTNDWIITSREGLEANCHTSIQQTQEHAKNSPYTNQQKQLELSAVFDDHTGSNYVNDIEAEITSSSSLLTNSPLIVGSEESVAERLICIGWGSFF